MCAPKSVLATKRHNSLHTILIPSCQVHRCYLHKDLKSVMWFGWWMFFSERDLMMTVQNFLKSVFADCVMLCECPGWDVFFGYHWRLSSVLCSGGSVHTHAHTHTHMFWKCCCVLFRLCVILAPLSSVPAGSPVQIIPQSIRTPPSEKSKKVPPPTPPKPRRASQYGPLGCGTCLRKLGRFASLHPLFLFVPP